MNHLLGSLDTVVFTSLEDEQKIRASVPLCLSLIGFWAFGIHLRCKVLPFKAAQA